MNSRAAAAVIMKMEVVKLQHLIPGFEGHSFSYICRKGDRRIYVQSTFFSGYSIGIMNREESMIAGSHSLSFVVEREKFMFY